MLLESGVPFMLAYDDTAKHMICRAFGNYPTLKEFTVTMMVQAVVNVQSNTAKNSTDEFLSVYYLDEVEEVPECVVNI